MNFKRIQWIFVIAFVLLDIGLCASLLMGTQFHNNPRQQSQTQVTLKEMRSDMISFKKLSNQRQDGYYFAAHSNNQWTSNSQVNNLRDQNARFANGIVTSSFQRNIKLNPSASLQPQTDRIVHSKRILHGRSYTYNPYLSSRQQVVYTQMMKGRPMLNRNGQIRLRINGDHEVTGYSQGYLSSVKTLRPRSLTISQQQAVTWLYRHNQIANSSRIRYVLLGYDQIDKNGNHGVYAPVWYVNVKSKNGDNVQHLRVNAFSGTLFKMNKDN